MGQKQLNSVLITKYNLPLEHSSLHKPQKKTLSGSQAKNRIYY